LQPGILEGVRVLDMAEGTAGSVAALLLAEAGADVVKVEPPLPGRGFAEHGRRTWDRSKRSVTADLATEQGVDLLHALLDRADVVVHELSPLRAARIAIDDLSLSQRHPHVIACSVLSWPANHADAELEVDELLAMARLGIFDEQRAMNREGPVLVRFPLGTWGAVYTAAIGVVARLWHRESTGRAGPAHTSLVQGALVPMGMHWSRAETPSEVMRVGMPKETGGSQASLFECSDGVWLHLMKCPDESPLMQKVFAEMGAGEVGQANSQAGEHAFGYPNRGANIVAFRSRTSAEWLADLWANDIPVQPACAFGDVLRDEQARANSYVVDIDDPDAGRITVAGLPLTTTPPSRVRSPAPRRGEHDSIVVSQWSPRPAPAPTAPPARWPLEGVRVLDLGNYLAGPYGPQVLADLGADVIKVESTSGDAMRGTEWAFAGCQRGKRSVALDLKDQRSRPALEALVRWADVVHHNVRLPAARRLRIDYESLRPINPTMIYCHTSSYGPEGPQADWPGYDQLFQAQCGWEWLGAGEGNPPMWHRFGFMDHQCALSSVVSTLLALYLRARTGEGQSVAGSLLGAGVLTASETYLRPDGTLAPFDGLDASQTRIKPGVEIVELVGGWIALAARTPEQVGALCEVAGTSDASEAAARLAGRERDSVLSELRAAGVPAEAVREKQKFPFFDDPSNTAAGLVASYRSAQYGNLEQPGALWYFGDLGVRLELAPPALGEHTREVLTTVGMDAAAIDDLIDSGVARVL
jgi:crotonobetainyl-CoA:carnitine CoA-transferase CaiB-like acyl-CoA transferase